MDGNSAPRSESRAGNGMRGQDCGFGESDGMKKVGEEGNNVADENTGLNMLRFE